MDDHQIERILAGDERAWQALVVDVEPLLSRVAARPSVMGRLAHDEDARRAVVVEVVGRLRERGFRRLRLYLETKRNGCPGSWEGWLATLCTRACVDHVRAHPEFLDGRKRGCRGRWVELVGLGHAPVACAPSPEQLVTAAILLGHARTQLRPEQREALHAWLAGLSFSDIAERLGLEEPTAAERMVRSALKRLRDRYAQSGASMQGGAK
jgi:DNA-directed RNA polymerase specialized sigma24 family protein